MSDFTKENILRRLLVFLLLAVLAPLGAAAQTTGVPKPPLSTANFSSTTSAQLRALLSDETGTGALVFGTSPSLTTPTIGGGATFSGSSSGTTVLQAAAAAGGTITLPSVTSTLATLGANTFTGRQLLPGGSVGAPALALSADSTTGFYDAETGQLSGSRVLGWSQGGRLGLSLTSRDDASGGRNSWLQFGDGTSIPDVAIDTYVATLSPRTVALAGANSTGIGFNIGSWVNNLANGVTYTQGQAMVELDKIDYQIPGNVDSPGSGSGTATINFTGALRARAPVPHRGVTIAENYSFMPIAPFPAGTGSTTTYYGYYHPQGSNATAGTVYGLYFREAPSGAALASHDAQELKLLSGAGGTTQADITLDAKNIGSRINLGIAGLKTLRIDGSGSQQNFVSLEANNTVTWRAQSATGEPNVGMDFVTRGAGNFSFYAANTEQVRINATASADRRLTLTGSNGGNPTIGTSAGDLAVSTGLRGAAAITSSGATSGIGYATGAGGTVTQATDKSTGVTLNKATGQVTLNNATLNADTSVSFTLTNSAIAATDMVLCQHISAGTAGAYTVTCAPGSGSATVTVRNITGGNLGEAIVIQFTVIKAVTASNDNHLVAAEIAA